MAYLEKDDIDLHKQEYDRMVAAIGFASRSPEVACALDVGGGGGMHSAFLTRIAKRVICTDFIDQNARYGGEFLKLLREKFERNDEPFDADRLEFHAGDAMDLMYKDGAFDLVVSFNALEHIPDPGRAVREVVRVLKPGALAYLTFDPIWACDTGSHFYNRVSRPWEHLILPPEEYARQMEEAGADRFEIDDFLTAMNKVRLEVFRKIFKDDLRGAKLVSYQEWRGVTDQAHLAHPNLATVRAMGYSDDDLMVRGIGVVLRRTSESIAPPEQVNEAASLPRIRRLLDRLGVG